MEEEKQIQWKQNWSKQIIEKCIKKEEYERCERKKEGGVYRVREKTKKKHINKEEKGKIKKKEREE